MPNMQVTVLTGYRDFEYAQQAVQLGVTRLLLKPSKMDEINEAMRAMTANLLRMEDSSASGESEQETAQKGANSFLVRTALAYMEAHYAEHLTLQDVADHCYVSQWHLSKLLNKQTEKSFYDLLNAIRIARAKQLLADPSNTIGEISEIVGYTDLGHFARTFKKMEGVSANEYRNHL